MLAQVADGPRSWAGVRNDRPETRPALDEAWIAPALAAIEDGVPYTVGSTITNRDRAIGARLAGEIALLRVNAEAPAEVTLNLTGIAGQSFGAFTVDGMRLVLDGQANDFVGKGLSGGEIVIRACGLAARDSGQHVILGNVALYGATSGSLYAAGRAGERFAVRNSGATAVVEGVGDHGCEYMTGGVVAVLGRAGMNFGAGMTGGLAWVYDADGSFIKARRYHPEFLEAEAFANAGAEAQLVLKALLAVHAERSRSSLSKRMLEDWDSRAQAFVRLTPKPQV
jgi:glutamate synthase (NADPH/NADH) large chain